MAAIDLVRSRVVPEVRGCPDVVVNDAIMDTVHDFCRKSGFITTVLESVVQYKETSFGNDTSEVFLSEAGRYLRPYAIKELLINGSQHGYEYLDETNKVTETYLSTGDKYITFTDNNSIKVFPVDVGDSITLRIMYTVDRFNTYIPNRLIQNHLNGIAAGAKALLMLMPNVAWSNPNSVGVYRSIFESELSIATASINKHYSGKGGRVRYRSFG
jgi:hypothetical protein